MKTSLWAKLMKRKARAVDEGVAQRDEGIHRTDRKSVDQLLREFSRGIVDTSADLRIHRLPLINKFAVFNFDDDRQVYARCGSHRAVV